MIVEEAGQPQTTVYALSDYQTLRLTVGKQDQARGPTIHDRHHARAGPPKLC